MGKLEGGTKGVKGTRGTGQRLTPNQEELTRDMLTPLYAKGVDHHPPDDEGEPHTPDPLGFTKGTGRSKGD